MGKGEEQMTIRLAGGVEWLRCASQLWRFSGQRARIPAGY